MSEQELSESPPYQESLSERLTRLHDSVLFDNLLATAKAVFLCDTPDYTLPDPNDDRTIVATIGARGLRGAVESVLNANQHDWAHNYFIKPLRQPEQYSNPTDPDVIHKAEAFGAALLRESFATLGADAYEQAAHYRNATTDDEQYAVIDWLDTRLLDMADSENVITTELDGGYYPGRLSPKLLGRYPDNHLNPTCLSVATIAASFFDKAGVDTLFATVNKQSYDHDIETAIGILMYTLNNLERHNTLLETTDDIKRPLNSTILKHLQPFPSHAAVYARLQSGAWVQFDSNYGSTDILDKRSGETLDEYQKTLDDLHPVAPELSLTAVLKQNIVPKLGVLKYIVEQIEYQHGDLSNVPDQLREVLNSDNDASFSQNVFDTIIRPFFEVEVADDVKAIKDIFIQNDDRHDQSDYDLQFAFYKTFEQFFLWDQPQDEVVSRCQTDESYFARRCEDLTILPFLMWTKLSAHLLRKASQEEGDTHKQIELGTPAVQIGLANLHELAVHMNNGPSVGFWLSHWPGRSAVTSNGQPDRPTNRDIELLTGNMQYLQNYPLTCQKNYDTIKSFLENPDYDAWQKQEARGPQRPRICHGSRWEAPEQRGKARTPRGEQADAASKRIRRSPPQPGCTRGNLTTRPRQSTTLCRGRYLLHSL